MRWEYPDNPHDPAMYFQQVVEQHLVSWNALNWEKQVPLQGQLIVVGMFGASSQELLHLLLVLCLRQLRLKHAKRIVVVVDMKVGHLDVENMLCKYTTDSIGHGYFDQLFGGERCGGGRRCLLLGIRVLTGC